jgi:hypothetical protein
MTLTESLDAPPDSGEVGDDPDPAPTRPRQLDLGVFCGLGVALIGLGLGASRIGDNSFLTHLATGREMLESGIVRSDVFTWTSPGETIVVQSWLASLVYGLVDAVAGFYGLRVLTAVLAAGLAGAAWRLTRANPSIITRLTIIVPLLAIGRTNWSERPLLMAFVLFAALMLVVEGHGKPGWLLVLGAVWINVHGSWPLGVVYLVFRIAGGLGDRESVGREWSALRSLGAGMLVGGVVNPYGPAMLVFPLRLLGRQEVLANVVEWQSPSFDSTWTRAFLLLVLACIGALMRRPRWRDALPMMVFVAAALVSRRNIALASLVVLPLLARGLPAMGRLHASRVSNAIHLGALAFVGLLVALPLVAVRGPHVDVGRYPEDAVGAMENELGLVPGETRIIHPDYVGNYLDIRYGDAGATWIDDRFELHDPALVADYLVLLDGGPEWASVLERYDAEAILWPRDEVLVELATKVGEWITVWSDEEWVVLCAPDNPTC